jgi:diguanylate cyclase (GGDEF)-like protein/PAS domain S-box-containing protein
MSHVFQTRQHLTLASPYGFLRWPLPGWVCMAMLIALCSLSSAWALTPADASATSPRVLVIGSEQDYPPFATGMTDATAGGFTVDLWKAVAADTGLRHTIIVRPFHQLLQDFKDGKIDVLINLAQSDERRKFVDFTVPHVIVHGAIFVRKGDPDMAAAKIRSESDLAGKSLIVLNADLAHDYAMAHGWGKQLVLVETAAEGMRLLASGQHDALLLSKLVGMQTLQAQEMNDIVALKLKLGPPQKFAFAVHKGDAELLYVLNEGLAMAKSGGAYDTLYNRWFGVFEAHEVELSDVLIYFYPLAAAFFLIGWYFWHRQQVERKQAAAAIAQSRDLLMTIINTVPVRVFWKDCNLRYLGCNTAFAEDAGCTHVGEVIGMNDHELVWSKQAELYHREDQAVIASGTAQLSYEEPLTLPSGQTRWLRVSKIPLRNQKNDIIGVLGVYEDITERKKAKDKLLQLSIAVEQSPTAIDITDLDGTIEYVNPRFTEVTGYTAAEAIGKNVRILKSMLTPAATYIDMWSKLTSGLSWHGELLNKRKDGELYWEESQISPVKNAQGKTTHYVGVKTDITLRKQLEEQVQHLAFHDALTKLPNRRMLDDRLSLAMATSKRSGRFAALMFLDLDHFKALNDLHGHHAGDALLLEVAQRLKNCVRATDTVARMGGDEFVVLLGELSDDKARSTELAVNLAEKIRAALSAPYLLTIAQDDAHDKKHDVQVEHRCSTSVGVMLFIGQDVSEEDILNRADKAMYLAKQDGGNLVRIAEIESSSDSPALPGCASVLANAAVAPLLAFLFPK